MSKYKINHGDSKEVLNKMPDECINAAVTSPPYWGLRDYGVDGQLGLEETPDEYVNNLCDIFDELKRVLKEDGTFWLNIGDTYKDSDLMGIPWKVVFEMKKRSWILRNDIIWYDPKPMPESVEDRCTTCHEHIFLFSKSKNYHFNQNKIKEPSVVPEGEHRGGSLVKIAKGEQEKGPEKVSSQNHGGGVNTLISDGTKNKRDVWKVASKPFSEAHFAVYPQELIKPCVKAGCPDDGIVLDPFFGAGTTGVVAKRLDRKFVGIELNEEYIDIAEERLNDYEWGEGFPQERELPDKAKFLTSVDGIGKKTAFNIWDHFDQNIHDIVTSDLTQVDGIGEKTYQQFEKEINNDQT
jgi:site-specific DNA-methyltransferase (adenine-specific)